jgi:Sec-independent protein translocase protein TatA
MLISDLSILILIGLIGLLLFGSRLPEVARALGQSVMELKNSFRRISPPDQSPGHRQVRRLEREKAERHLLESFCLAILVVWTILLIVSIAADWFW